MPSSTFSSSSFNTFDRTSSSLSFGARDSLTRKEGTSPIRSFGMTCAVGGTSVHTLTGAVKAFGKSHGGRKYSPLSAFAARRASSAAILFATSGNQRLGSLFGILTSGGRLLRTQRGFDCPRVLGGNNQLCLGCNSKGPGMVASLPVGCLAELGDISSSISD